MSRRALFQLPSLLACGAVSFASAPAWAQNPAAAEALFEQARAAMAAGSYDIACARFRDSDKLDPAVGTRFNLADCEERRGRVATAWSLFRGVLAELASDDDRRPIAEERAQRLEPRLPMLTLVRTPQTPPDLKVRVDGALLGEGSFGVPLPMDPGAHDLSLQRADGSSPQQRRFTLTEGKRNELLLEFVGAGAPATAPAPGSHQGAASTDAGRSRQRWAYVAGGVGAGGVVFGTVTGIITLNKKSTADANCNETSEKCNAAGIDANESGKTYAALSGIGFGVGVVGLAVGAYLLLTAPGAAPPAAAAHSSIPRAPSLLVFPELHVAAESGFVGVAGRF